MTQTPAAELHESLLAFHDAASRGVLPLHLPAAASAPTGRGEGHFHLAPELFLQVAGWTDFRFPDGGCRLRAGEALLAFGSWRAANVMQAAAYRNLSETGDLREAASNLFSHLATLDRSGASTIAVEPLPLTGLGEAINDRLARAAAPREADAETGDR